MYAGMVHDKTARAVDGIKVGFCVGEVNPGVGTRVGLNVGIEGMLVTL